VAPGIVDPEPWFRRQRDDRLAELQRELEAGAEKKQVRKEIRKAKRDYRRALGHRLLGRRW
jgi:hypothetical protein